MRNSLIRARGLNIEKVKIIIPEILIECKDYLTYTNFGNTKLTYDRIKEFYPEEQGDLDHCRGHYQLQPRLEKELFSGRLVFAYNEKKSELDVGVVNQSSVYHENEAKAAEITERIKMLLDKEKLNYKEIDI